LASCSPNGMIRTNASKPTRTPRSTMPRLTTSSFAQQMSEFAPTG
jgi:hypothetical protein